LHQGLDLPRFGDIGFEEEGLASCLLDHPHRGFASLDSDIGHHHLGIFACKGQGCRSPNA
jgi:hypothetical protein